ncbi:sulfatase [Pararhizobium mangrovi]|uniref:Sulfatase n=1 Tax=Pararhizobium mangrovi TaxID=2590452 RepID=A0A506UBU0_9HYPH|nr:sulfatase [Pararhizobium mangrovi]
MKAVFVLFDSLNRLALEAYGGTMVDTPNFNRLAERGVTFDRHYVGSLPCMPARRDMHTGRLSFTHRSWGPLEPFDNSFAEILKNQGVYTHLVTDHFHYFEDGGAGYHTKYNSWDFIRGQEYDPWKAMVEPPLDRFRNKFSRKHYDPEHAPRRMRHMVNLELAGAEEQLPGPGCFASAFEFLETNKDADDWLLQLEVFDPHEPFHAPERFRREGDSTYSGGILDWPEYKRVTDSPEEVREIRANYAALVRMCDEYFGRLLDFFDANDLWKDTALVLTTDHGFLLSEHEWWGKVRMPYYEEVSHVPLMVYHPDFTEHGGARCSAVTQTPDLMPTFLDMFGAAIPKEVRGSSLLAHLRDTAGQEADPGKRAVAFGVFGGPIAVTDGRHVMFHYPPDVRGSGLHEYTLNPQHMSEAFALRELETAELGPSFDFTKGIRLLRIDALSDANRVPQHDDQTFQDQWFALYDLESDPRQECPIRDAEVEARLYSQMHAILADIDTPREAYGWYGLECPA